MFLLTLDFLPPCSLNPLTRVVGVMQKRVIRPIDNLYVQYWRTKSIKLTQAAETLPADSGNYCLGGLSEGKRITLVTSSDKRPLTESANCSILWKNSDNCPATVSIPLPL